MYRLIAILILTLAAGVCSGYAHPPNPGARNKSTSGKTKINPLSEDQNPQTPEGFASDSLNTRLTERNQRMYDSLAVKFRRRAVPRLIYGAFFVRPKLDTTLNGMVVDESRLLEPYAGKTIGDITIRRDPVFDVDGSKAERLANKIHVTTRERIVRRDLLFRTGDKLDPQLVVRNKQLLRSRAYISDVDVIVLPDSTDTTRVDLVIRTRDSWTIGMDGDLHTEGRSMIGVYDANILGTGNKLNIMTNINRRDFSYGGEMFEYQIPNLLGTFFTVDFLAGREFYNTTLDVGLYKEFIKPTDYEIGFNYSDNKSKHYMIDLDTALLVKVRTYDVWAGRSALIKPINSSIFLTGRYTDAHYSMRPDVWIDHNPALHNYRMMLFGTGLYREKFYSANMIYGYGTREYLATGYKAELVGGYMWGEFRNMMYLGASYQSGGFRPMGYLMGLIGLGSYIDLRDGTWRQAVATVEGQWFSNLFMVRRSRLRQFLGFSYTQGWNRGTGSDESIKFTRRDGLQAFNEYTPGTNRMFINTETVLFTPYQPLGFRIAVFGFADFGLIGYSPNIFKNDFYTSFGLGVRIKNERLIFNTLQIRLGIAFGKRGLVGSEYIRLSNQSQIERYRYRPTRPEMIGFR